MTDAPASPEPPDRPAVDDEPAGEAEPDVSARPTGPAYEVFPPDEITDPTEFVKTGLIRARTFVRAVPRRQRITAAATALLVLAAAVAWLVWPNGSLGPDVEVDADRTVPLIEDLPEDVRPEEEAAGTQDTEIPGTEDDPAWTYDTGEDEQAGLRAVDGGYVVIEDGGLTGLDAKGDETWTKDTDGETDIGDTAVTITNDIESDESWPGRNKTTVLDAETGRKLWSDSTASFVSTWHDTVYLSLCQGGQDGELGECVVSARDPRSGATRWSRPTYASTSVITAAADGSFVVFQSHVTSGGDIRHTVVDTNTGAVLSGGSDQDGYGGGDVFLVGDLLINVGDDDNPADDCRLPVSATNVRTGQKVWDRKLGVAAEGDGDRCDELEDPYGDRVMAYNGKDKAIVVNLTTGKTEWTGPKDARPRFSDGKHALVAVQDGDLALYDTGSDKKLWTLPGVVDLGGVLFTKQGVYFDTEDLYADDQCWIRVDNDSGDPVRYPGSCAGSGPDWIATATDDGTLSMYDVK